MDKLKKVNEYIKNSWHKSVRKNDADPDFVMPYAYTSPCIPGKEGAFIHLYYWDTYFINKGLYADGLEKYAFGNIEDLKFSLRKFGCVPNMCKEFGAKFASQPPLLVFMVDDYYEFSKNKAFLADSYEALKTEYKFWMEKRISPTGLNRWGCNLDYRKVIPKDENVYFNKRTGQKVVGTWEDIIRCYENNLAQGESGQDNTQRYMMRAAEINAVDLNSYLYGFEKTMAKFACILGEKDIEWLEKAENRKILMDKYLLDESTGIYFDYIFTDGKRTGIYCVDNYTPFIFGISNDKQVVEKINDILIKEHGVVSTAIPSKNGENYQWGYPNAWAPHQYWSYMANIKVGNTNKAREIATKYLNTVADEFLISGTLYEKYDAVNGGKSVVNEYGVPEMLGWTAGIYEYFYKEFHE